jgi:CCR4-NOT transcriptional regulation complex NOT5 subunit
MSSQHLCVVLFVLKDLLNCTPQNHEDYNDLKLAVEKINLICVYVNEKKRDAENLDLVLNIQEKLVPGKKETAVRKVL